MGRRRHLVIRRRDRQVKPLPRLIIADPRRQRVRTNTEPQSKPRHLGERRRLSIKVTRRHDEVPVKKHVHRVITGRVELDALRVAQGEVAVEPVDGSALHRGFGVGAPNPLGQGVLPPDGQFRP